MRIVSWLLQVKCGLELNEEVERMRRSRELFTRSPQADRGAESICARSDFDLNSENTKYPLSEIAAR
jgi:hypothetical protein